jgi:hypothetical protein
MEELTSSQKELLVWKGEGFDLRTHIVDPSSGKLIKVQPYRRVVSKEDGTFYIRDGKRYSEQGHLMDPEPEQGKAPHEHKKLSKQ